MIASEVYNFLLSSPHRITPTSMILLWLHKLHEGPGDRLLGVQFGLAATQAGLLFKNFVHFVYEHDEFLWLSRNLSQPGYVKWRGS